jgi:hypothetical protein
MSRATFRGFSPSLRRAEGLARIHLTFFSFISRLFRLFKPHFRFFLLFFFVTQTFLQLCTADEAERKMPQPRATHSSPATSHFTPTLSLLFFPSLHPFALCVLCCSEDSNLEFLSIFSAQSVKNTNETATRNWVEIHLMRVN